MYQQCFTCSAVALILKFAPPFTLAIKQSSRVLDTTMKFLTAIAPSAQQSRLSVSRPQIRNLTAGLGLTPRRRVGPTVTRHRQRVVRTQALALPALVPVVARALTAGILFYASMNWVYYRGMRKDVSFMAVGQIFHLPLTTTTCCVLRVQAEKQTKEHEEYQESRRRQVDRLGPKDKRKD